MTSSYTFELKVDAGFIETIRMCVEGIRERKSRVRGLHPSTGSGEDRVDSATSPFWEDQNNELSIFPY